MEKAVFCLLLTSVLALIGHGDTANPGLKVIASQSGLDYAGSEAVQVVSQQVSGMPIPDQSGRGDTPVGKVDYWLTGMKVTGFNPPTSSVTLQPGQGATWSLQGAGLSVHGDWRYEYKKAFIKIKDHGSFDVSASGIGITLSVTMGESGGVPTLSTTGCSSTVGDVDIKFHGGASWLYNLFKHYVEKALRSALQDAMCKAATKAVNEDLAEQLAKINWVIPVDDIVELDYSMVAPPDFEASFLTIFNKGEVYWMGDHTEAPFQPAPFPDVGQPQMLTVMISDYVVNTMSYVLQQHGQIQHNLTKNDLPEKDQYYLNTTCTGVCIGSLLPQVGKLYPGLSVELEMATTQAPALNIQPQNIQGDFTGYINYYVRLSNGSRAFLLATDLNVTVDVTAYFQDMLIKINVTKLSPQIKVTKSAIGKIYDQVLQAIFTSLADLYIVPKLNELGQKGLELPTMNNVDYVNPALKLLQGGLMLSTDLQYNPSQRAGGAAGELHYERLANVVQLKDVSKMNRPNGASFTKL